MKRAILTLIPVLLIGLIFLSEVCQASQDPNDPYGPDSVLFRSKQLLVPCPPQGGQAVLPLYFRNDTPILGVQIPLSWSGPAVLDSTSFFGSRISYVVNKQVNIDNLNKKVLVTAQVGFQQSIPDGRGMLVKFYFSTTDTGDLIIDTVANSPQPEEHLLFTREDSVTYTPLYRRGEFHLTCEHDPNDPGLPDSVSFSQALAYYPIPSGPYAYYPLPSGPGKVYAHLQVENSDSVGIMIIPLLWAGPVGFDSITFQETIFGDSVRIVNVDTLNHKALITLIPVNDPPVPPSEGLFATLCFTLTDLTGLLAIDSTFTAPMSHILFTTTEPQGYCPQYIPGEFPVLKYWPGDITFDGELVDVADIVYLLNFIYKNGPYPSHPVSADVNGPDRLIDIEDVVYLINYLYRHGSNPLPGDPW
ncbi:MAG: hypothetical protein ABII96_07670 [Candidatus Zixiibacteriota bacterium]